MYFDREALGAGITVFSQMKNGKAEAELTAYLTHEKLEGLVVEFCMKDRSQNTVSAVCAPAQPVTTVNTLLIYPHLWQAVEDPYLYEATAVLLRGEEILDEVRTTHAIRTFGNLPVKGFCLNEKPFALKAVRYELPPQISGNDIYQNRIRADMDAVMELGANTVCLTGQPRDPFFYELCEEKGILVWQSLDTEKSLPQLCGEAGKGLMTMDRRRKRDLYYAYKARWSRTPFVYISGHEDYLRDGETTTVTVYSNQKKAALYVNGILHEFKESAPCFLFEEVPLKKQVNIISVQAGDCYSSMTVQKGTP